MIFISFMEFRNVVKYKYYIPTLRNLVVFEMVTSEELRKELSKRIDDLVEEKSETMRNDDPDGFSFAVPSPATLKRLADIDDEIAAVTESLLAVERRLDRERVKAEDADIAARREAFPLH